MDHSTDSSMVGTVAQDNSDVQEANEFIPEPCREENVFISEDRMSTAAARLNLTARLGLVDTSDPHNFAQFCTLAHFHTTGRAKCEPKQTRSGITDIYTMKATHTKLMRVT